MKTFDVLTIEDVAQEIRIGVMMMRRRKEREEQARRTTEELTIVLIKHYQHNCMRLPDGRDGWRYRLPHKRRETMMHYKEIQRANESRYKRSQRGKVICRPGHHACPMRVHKPGRYLSKSEKKRTKILSRSVAILNATAEGKTVLRNKALKVSRDGNTLTLEGGC